MTPKLYTLSEGYLLEKDGGNVVITNHGISSTSRTHINDDGSELEEAYPDVIVQGVLENGTVATQQMLTEVNEVVQEMIENAQ